MSAAPTHVSEIRTLLRVSFLMRMVTLLICLLAFVNQSLSVLTAGAIVLLTLTSMAGLSIEGAPAFLERHPLVVMLDGVVMTMLMVALGVDNPLILVALSSSVVIGVALPLPAALLSTSAMVSGYLVASLESGREERVFLVDFGLPIALVTVVVLGQVFRRIAEQKRQSERAFADLVAGTVTAEERARLARELHDSTAKTLQGLSLTARSLDHWIERDPLRAAEEAREIASSADDAVARLRQLLAALRHDDLAQPFHDALATLARDLGQTHGVRVALDLAPVSLSAPGVRYELLAASREAISNAMVHSGADKVSVTMRVDGDEVRIHVHDAGSGFSLDILPGRELDGHFGVRGYSERLALIGGRAEVTSAPGRGTLVVLSAPVMGLVEAQR